MQSFTLTISGVGEIYPEMTGYSDQAKMTRNLADADKPRDALRSVKVTKHGTNRHVKYATITFSLVRSVF